MNFDLLLCHDLFVYLFRILGKPRHRYFFLVYGSIGIHSFSSFSLGFMIDDYYGVY